MKKALATKYAKCTKWSPCISVPDEKRGPEGGLWYQGRSRVCPGCLQSNPREVHQASWIRDTYGKQRTLNLEP